MPDPRALLNAYDDQLRTDSEAAGAIAVNHLGPLLLATFEGGQGFVTYRDLGGADAAAIALLVERAVVHFDRHSAIVQIEWKTRAHDHAPGLHRALIAHGFTPGEPESVMIGEARALAVEVPVPDWVTLRRISSEQDVRAMCAMQDEAFGESSAPHMADALRSRLARGDEMELWVAEAGSAIVSAGRLEPVSGTDFAGIWGGATLPDWRGRGIYRALTAARARSALAMGKTLIQSDSTEFSRPILERSGLIKVSTTTPYLRRRPR